MIDWIDAFQALTCCRISTAVSEGSATPQNSPNLLRADSYWQWCGTGWTMCRYWVPGWKCFFCCAAWDIVPCCAHTFSQLHWRADESKGLDVLFQGWRAADDLEVLFPACQVRVVRFSVSLVSSSSSSRPCLLLLLRPLPPPCQTSTATICTQCSLPDLYCDHLRPGFPGGPQPRSSAASVPAGISEDMSERMQNVRWYASTNRTRYARQNVRR